MIFSADALMAVSPFSGWLVWAVVNRRCRARANRCRAAALHEPRRRPADNQLVGTLLFLFELAVEDLAELAAGGGFEHRADLDVAFGFFREPTQHHLGGGRLVGRGDSGADVAKELQAVNRPQRRA